MLFKGIAPSVRYSDPEHYRFEIRLIINYFNGRFIAFSEQMIKTMANFSETMKTVGASFERFAKHFPKGELHGSTSAPD